MQQMRDSLAEKDQEELQEEGGRTNMTKNRALYLFFLDFFSVMERDDEKNVEKDGDVGDTDNKE